MNLNSAMRVTYALAWVFAALALIQRALEYVMLLHVNLPATSRGMLFFSAFLFLATMATAAYAQAQHEPGTKARGTTA